MELLPMSLESLSPIAQEVVDRWWSGLEPEARQKLNQAILDEGVGVVGRLVGPPSLVFEMCGEVLPEGLDDDQEPFEWTEVWRSAKLEPPARIAHMPARERALATNWWDSLDADERARVEQAWGGHEQGAQHLIGGADALFEIEGEYVEGDAQVEEREREMWERELLEYASEGSDRMQWIVDEPRIVLGGCRAHAKAKATVRAGMVPEGFACPYGARACPMRAALDRRPGTSLLLSIRPRL